MMTDSATVAELSDAELDLVAAGSLKSFGPLVIISVPISLNLGVLTAVQTNVAVLSAASQGGSQLLSLSQHSLSFSSVG